jgi:opacity protein-like surface antigen
MNDHIKEIIMKKTNILFLALTVALISTTSPASAENKPADYVAFKAGVYSPSMSHDLDTFNAGNRTHLDSKTGFAGEIAVGHYFIPMLALELGAGYFESKGSPATPPGELKLQVVPLIATGKVLLPIGPFEPYGLFGIGAYITDLNVHDNNGTFKSSTEVTYGLHAGAGLNINFQNNMFVGVEGKYLWADPSFGGQHIKLDGFVTTAVLGFRY